MEIRIQHGCQKCQLVQRYRLSYCYLTFQLKLLFKSVKLSTRFQHLVPYDLHCKLENDRSVITKVYLHPNAFATLARHSVDKF